MARRTARSVAVYRADALTPRERRRGWRRPFAALALAVLLLPAIWLHDEIGERDELVAITALAHESGAVNGFTVQGLWQLHGPARGFGGYSAMAPADPDRIRLFSDKGWLLTFPRPDRHPEGVAAAEMGQLHPTGIPATDLFDIESAAYHPGTGQFWVGYENRHTLYRYSAGDEPEAYVEPPFTRDWPANEGMEAITRLADGRFIVLRETGGEGFLYPGDPVEGAEPLRFATAWPEGFSPTDMTQLPDGRVLVLLRKVAWHVPVFESLIAIADPAAIDPARPWPMTVLVEVEKLIPRDNWEAMMVEPLADGTVVLWLASDDNRSALQRSLLANLHWTPTPLGIDEGQ